MTVNAKKLNKKNMRKHFIFLLILPFIIVSCNDNDEDYLHIEGITETTASGEITGVSVDPDDWNLDDVFTKREKQLFGDLDFSKTAVVEPVPIPECPDGMDCIDPIEDINDLRRIVFCPNPFDGYAFLRYYHSNHILNLVVVDNKYNKLYSRRVENVISMFFSIPNLKKGIYRMYYVIQDMDNNIVHCGHGDIKMFYD